jgi:hypothetical protein
MPKLDAAAYIQQIGPADWMKNPDFWVDAPTLLPPALALGSKILISDHGNMAIQVQAQQPAQALIVQWGRNNLAEQSQAGLKQRAEVVQVSLGATTSGRANGGRGNGSEFDLFGFEIDPGNSGAHNQAKEPGASGWDTVGGNEAHQYQSGSDHFARSVQIGGDNDSVQKQSGSQHDSVVVQLGDTNRAMVVQAGSGNASIVAQVGAGNEATVHQSD